MKKNFNLLLFLASLINSLELLETPVQSINCLTSLNLWRSRVFNFLRKKIFFCLNNNYYFFFKIFGNLFIDINQLIIVINVSEVIKIFI